MFQFVSLVTAWTNDCKDRRQKYGFDDSDNDGENDKAVEETLFCECCSSCIVPKWVIPALGWSCLRDIDFALTVLVAMDLGRGETNCISSSSSSTGGLFGWAVCSTLCALWDWLWNTHGSRWPESHSVTHKTGQNCCLFCNANATLDSSGLFLVKPAAFDLEVLFAEDDIIKPRWKCTLVMCFFMLFNQVSQILISVISLTIYVATNAETINPGLAFAKICFALTCLLKETIATWYYSLHDL